VNGPAELVLDAAGGGALLRADARFAGGLWVVQSPAAQALSSLIALASGVEAPARGRVTFASAPPFTTPEVRRQIAALLAFETFPEGGDLRSAVARAFLARGEPRNVDAFLAEFGFMARARKPVNDLDAAERRALALGLALHHEKARLLALYEPLSANQAKDADHLRTSLERRAEDGAVVLIATASAAVAAAFGGAHFVIEGGVLRSAASVTPLGVPSLLSVETPEPKRLIAAVSTEQGVSGVVWNEREAPFTVVIHGSDVETLGTALGRAVAMASVPIERVRPWTSAQPLHASGQPLYASGQPGTALPPVAHPLDPQAARPADQSVAMPTAFADPTRPSGPTEAS
jgi:ABC-type transport system involved in cytochrome c biogenesis ATPase subunit